MAPLRSDHVHAAGGRLPTSRCPSPPSDTHPWANAHIAPSRVPRRAIGSTRPSPCRGTPSAPTIRADAGSGGPADVSEGRRRSGRSAWDERRLSHPDPVVLTLGAGDEQLEGGAGDLVERHPH